MNKLIERRVEAAYYRRCQGVQVSVMDIPRIFRAGETAVRDNPTISDADLGDVIAKFVETIRHN